MHISEGILSAPVLAAGAAVTVGGLAMGLRKIDHHNVPQVAVLTSAFFIGSLISFPLGPGRLHLVLNGINGVVLGWAAFPSIFVALALQALLFQMGGFTVLGVNTTTMAVPAIVCYYAFGPGVRSRNKSIAALSGFGAGFTSVLIGTLLMAGTLVTTGDEFIPTAKLVVVSHLPLMVIEGIFTAICVVFLGKVKPEIFGITSGNSEDR
jgi:cobalt/nickel transport system permease protein